MVGIGEEEKGKTGARTVPSGSGEEEEEIMEYGEHTISNFNRETVSLETKKEAWEGWKAAQELNESKQYLYTYDSETS